MKHETPTAAGERSYLDMLYADKPKRPELFRWPVHDDYWCCSRPVAWFDDYGSAVDAVQQATNRNLYIGEPRRVKP